MLLKNRNIIIVKHIFAAELQRFWIAAMRRKMDIKEKVYISFVGTIIFSVNLLLYCKWYPSTRLLMPMAIGLGCMILPWIKEKMIHKNVMQIELWETDETGKRLRLLRELSKEERKTVSQIFRKFPYKVNKGKDGKMSCAGVALRVIYKKQKETLYLTRENSRCFVMRDKISGVVLKEKEAQKVKHIISCES